jgi:hypothetical protein
MNAIRLAMTIALTTIAKYSAIAFGLEVRRTRCEGIRIWLTRSPRAFQEGVVG